MSAQSAIETIELPREAVLIRKFESMVNRRVRGGCGDRESRELLARLMTDLSGDNLDHALVYNGFCMVRDGKAVV